MQTLRKITFVTSACLALLQPASVWAINPDTKAEPNTVALTFDLCDGSVDKDLLALLWHNKEAVTLFVTAKWISKNPEVVAWLKDKQTVFVIENHGLNHHQTILSTHSVHGLAPTVTPAATLEEASGGKQAIEQVFGRSPAWFRSAGASFDAGSVALLKPLYGLAGYTVNGDDGAGASKAEIKRRLQRLKTGDVVLLHANHPSGHTFEALRDWIKMPNRQKLGVLKAE